MTTLKEAHAAVSMRNNAQEAIETTLRSSLQEYLDFLPERGSAWVPHYKNAIDYTFTEIDGKNFIFQGEEHYQYGETDTPYISLPFDFVDAPETFKARILDEIKYAEDKRKARIKATQEEKVASLKAQLAAAEAQLAKSATQNDPIRTIATRRQEEKLRAELAITETREVE
jgi:hypothetical protein